MIIATYGTGAFVRTLATCVGALPSGGLTKNICLAQIAVGAGVEDSLAIFILKARVRVMDQYRVP